MDVVSDPEANRFLNELGSELLEASSSDLARRRWTFHLVADDSVNAFNIPGGHVYVNTGLVKALGTHAELASVVGHEAGHGLARHGTRQLSAQYGLSILMSLVLGSDPSATSQIVSSFAAGSALMKFSRDDEIQADRTAIHLMYGAGIDPQGAVDMLEVLESLQERDPSRIDRLLASHPLPSDRIATARERVDSLPPKAGLRRQTGDFLAFKVRVEHLR